MKGDRTVAQFAFFVEIEVDPAHREAFDDVMMRHSKRTLDEEEGCLVFDVYVSRRNPNRYAVYELFADEAALEVHVSSDRLRSYREATDPIVLTENVWNVGDKVDVTQLPGAR